MPPVRPNVPTAAAHDYRMSAFITGIVESAAFQMNEVGMTPATSTDALEPSDTGHKP
jgi:hypothetical protein